MQSPMTRAAPMALPCVVLKFGSPGLSPIFLQLDVEARVWFRSSSYAPMQMHDGDNDLWRADYTAVTVLKHTGPGCPVARV